jgi:hypothetical protein
MTTVVVENRVVLKYAPEGWVAGFIIGHFDDLGFYIEHLVVGRDAPRGTLLRLIRAGLAVARERRVQYLQLHVAESAPQSSALRALATRFGFIPHVRDEDGEYYVKFMERS